MGAATEISNNSNFGIISDSDIVTDSEDDSILEKLMNYVKQNYLDIPLSKS